MQVLLREEKTGSAENDADVSHNVIFSEKSKLVIFIIDDGKGCNLEEVLSEKSLKNHFGLRMMKERIAMLKDASIEFHSQVNDGMQIKITFSQG